MLIIWENKIVCCDNWSFENIHNSGPSGDTKKGSLLLRGYMSCQNRRSRRVKRVRRIKTRKARRLPKSHSRRPSKSHVDNCLARMAIVQGNGIGNYEFTDPISSEVIPYAFIYAYNTKKQRIMFQRILKVLQALTSKTYK